MKNLKIMLIWLDWVWLAGTTNKYRFPRTWPGLILRFLISLVIFPVMYIAFAHIFIQGEETYNYFEQVEKYPKQQPIWIYLSGALGFFFTGFGVTNLITIGKFDELGIVLTYIVTSLIGIMVFFVLTLLFLAIIELSDTLRVDWRKITRT